MKRYILSALVAIALPSMVQAESVWSGGIDTEWARDAQGRYEITTADELAGLAQRVNTGETFAGEIFVLADDINLGDYQSWTPIGYIGGLDCGGTTSVFSYFSGTFDGQGRTISNMYVHYEQDFDDGFFGWGDAKEVRLASGLFGAINGATIINLVVRDSYVYHSTGHYSNMGGAVVGFSTGNSVITNCVAINNAINVFSPYKWIGVGMGRAYAGAICGASGNPNTVSGIETNSDASVTDCAVAGNAIVATGNMSSKPADVINGPSSDTNNVYSDESAIAADKDAIARKNERAIRANVVENANPPHYLWDEETGLLTDMAVFSLNTTPEIIGGGALAVYCPTAKEYTIDGTIYTTITKNDEIHISGIEYSEPTREKDGYQMYYYRIYCSGAVILQQEATGMIDFDHTFTGATGNVTVEGVFAPNYLVEIETNGVSDAFIYGESSYIAYENELVSVTLLTDTIYEANGSYRYFTIKSITLNESDVLDMVVPGQVSLLEFAMPANSVLLKVEFEENVYTSVEGATADAMHIYGIDDALIAVATEPQSLVVVTIDGRVVYNGTIEGRTRVALPAGIYIANGNKVVVR